jgi:hypothetical protein
MDGLTYINFFMWMALTATKLAHSQQPVAVYKFCSFHRVMHYVISNQILEDKKVMLNNLVPVETDKN